uniref:NADH-ubiquinone oxidoreductase chain 6 n=1 Tax=Neocyema erythrosoma TaxID=2024705 RepID=A0A347ZJT6_9TELE|nr:NADH dehydrogenase subunit 6 [Neocyema erythrosoma]BBA85501.1 NADH dehydrogenase subunit 6 [Neocyema erythrosoma]
MNYISFSQFYYCWGFWGGIKSSPYYAALGSVGGFGVGLYFGMFDLFGGMQQYSYSAALIADPYPEAWGIWPVLGRVLFFGLLVMIWGFMFGDWEWGYNMGWGLMPMPASGNIYCGVADELHNLSYLRGDFCGVAFLYGLGGMMLIICGWGLLITLFSVLELVRGQSRGALRAI